MFNSQTSNNKYNLLHERPLIMIYNDQTSSFDELVENDNFFTFHDFNIQSLATEIFIVSNNAAIIMP